MRNSEHIRFLGDWNKALEKFGSQLTAIKTMKTAKRKAMGKLAVFFGRKLKENIKNGGQLAEKPFAINSDLTMERKGSEKPLIDSADMRNSITPHVIDENTGFVGIMRGMTHRKSGKEMVDIALVHEFGAMVQVTQKMRGFFAVNFGIHMRADKKYIEIPARPFMMPVLEKFEKEAFQYYVDNLEKNL
jgi:phage gpG-like protein